jgi:hypothetical protein
VPVKYEDNDAGYRLPGQYVQSDNAEPVNSGAAPIYEDNDSHYQLPGSYVARDNPDVAVSVKAGVYGGSMERVAKSMLGTNASQRDINNYVGQLLEINGINDPRRVQAGQDILLPDASTLAATKGLAIYGKDIALGKQMKVEAAQAQRERWDAMQTGAWSGRTDPGGPVWYVGGSEGSIAFAPLSGLQRAQAHALGVFDAGVGAVEGAGNSFGIVGTHEERAAWAMRTAAATVEGIKRFASAPGDALSGWMDDLSGNDPVAIRQATAKGAGVAMSVASGVVVGRLGGLRTAGLSYDISKWSEYGLPSDGYFVRTLTREQYRDLQAGRSFDFGGKPTEHYPAGMGFIGSAEEVRGLSTVQGYREGLKLNYDPKYVLEFQLSNPSGLQNVIRAPYAEFVPGGKTGAGFSEWNYPGINSNNIVNAKVRVLK